MGELQKQEPEEHVLCFLHKVLSKEGSRTHKAAGGQDMLASMLLGALTVLSGRHPKGSRCRGSSA